MAKSKKAPAKKAAPKKKAGAASKAAKKIAQKASGKKSAAAVKAVGKKTVKKAAKNAPPAKKNAAASKKAVVPSKVKSSQTKVNVNWEKFLTPLDDRLIVQVSEGEKMTAGGLYIPDTVSDTSGNFRGTVLVSGRGHRDPKGKIHPMELKAGDVILFSEFSGAKLNLLNEDVRILRESEVLGIVDKK